MKNIKSIEFILHKTKRSVLKRFFVVLVILLLYFTIVSFKYGIKEGILVSLLTWSFFVFCTPIADAGFLLDFPIRLVTGMKMIYSEILVWLIAGILNAVSLIFNPNIYEKTSVLKLFKQILINPYPFWGIIIFSAAGTFLSIYFGDELLDVVNHEDRKKFITHKKKYRYIVLGFILIVTIIFYKELLKYLGISI